MTELPNNNIFEVSLIGTGGGYGESVVIHLGNQNWAIVDSCINPETKISLPLEYLKSKGVNINTDVKLIICTHWHDDHILGISELLKSCESAVFCMARTNDREKFLQFVGLDFNKAKSEPSDSSTIEIDRCFKIIKDRRNSFKSAEQDKLLFSIENAGIKSTIFSLSPSDFVVNEFDKEISTLITEYGCQNRKVTIQSPNDKSVTLLVTVNNQSILLGSDLEVSNSNQKGWLCILDNCECIKTTKSSLFKIPHHGSENGYNERVWKELLTSDATAKLTPWNKGNKLPTKEMLETFLIHTCELYITSYNVSSNSAKKRERSITKAIEKFNKSVSEVKYKYGIIRSRLNVSQDDSVWETRVFGEAKKVTTDYVDKFF